MRTINWALGLVLLFVASLQVPNATAGDLQDELDRLAKDPKAFYNTPPAKFRTSKLEIQVKRSLFATEKIADNSFVELKMKSQRGCRQGTTLLSPAGRSLLPESSMQPGDNPRDLIIEDDITFDLQTMEDEGLLKARLKFEAWSGDYWPIARGILGARYTDYDFMELGEWTKYFDFITENPFYPIFETGKVEAITALAPSEKYDLIINDSKGTLTEHMWIQGKQYQDEYGEVEEWMGICHGWAPAAYMTKEPRKSIEVIAGDGKTNIKLFPHDVKGLASYLWATTSYEQRFIGGRCRDKKPEVDDLGRVTDPDCLDTNPGSWHVSITNQLGRYQRSFVMDATFDYEVWNHPVISYDYTYFNPQTKAVAKTLAEATVSKKDYTNDKFKDYRTEKAVNYVGISMVVGYLVESAAIDSEDINEQYLDWVRYTYDLELDKDGKIIGGEWFTKAHPDFLWSPTPNARPLTPIDDYIHEGDWVGEGALPERWQNVGKIASKYGLVLGKIVEVLSQMSSD